MTKKPCSGSQRNQEDLKWLLACELSHQLNLSFRAAMLRRSERKADRAAEKPARYGRRRHQADQGTAVHAPAARRRPTQRPHRTAV